MKQKQTGVVISGKVPHYPQYSYDIIRIHFLMIYTDIIEYKKVGDTKNSFLHSIPLISKVKKGEIISTGQYLTYQSVTNQQFKQI